MGQPTSGNVVGRRAPSTQGEAAKQADVEVDREGSSRSLYHSSTCKEEESLQLPSGHFIRASTLNKIKAFTRIGSHNYEQLRELPPQPDTDRKLGGASGPFDDEATAGSAIIVTIDKSQSGEGPAAARDVGNGTEDSHQYQRSPYTPGLQRQQHSLNNGMRTSIPSPCSGFQRTYSSSNPETPRDTQEARLRGGPGGSGEVAGNGFVRRTSLVRDPSYDFLADVAGFSSKVSEESNEGDTSSTRRTKSFDFGCDSVTELPDPPSRLIRDFLQRQSASGNYFLDLDMDMEELTTKRKPPQKMGGGGVNANGGPAAAIAVNGFRNGNGTGLDTLPEKRNKDLRGMQQPGDRDTSSSSSGSPTSTGPRASPGIFTNNVAPATKTAEVAVDMPQIVKVTDSSTSLETFTMQQAGKGGGSPGLNGVGMRSRNICLTTLPSMEPRRSSAGEQDQVLKSPAAYTKPPFSRLKSRLADIPKPVDLRTFELKDEAARRSTQVSGALRSGVLGKLRRVDEEEDDPLKDADLPDKYRRVDKGFWAILQWVLFFAIVGGLATILSFRNLREMKRGGLLLWKWGLLVMVVFSGRLVAGWIIWLLVIIIEKNFLLRKKVLYFVYALRKGVQNCLWLGFALLAWHMMIGPKVDNSIKVVKYVTKILWCCLLGAVIILVKTLIVKVFASSFHVSNYFERIQEALFNQYLMETLSGPPYLEIEMNIEEDKNFYAEIALLKEAGATGPSLPKTMDGSPLGPNPRKSGAIASQMLNKSGGPKSGLVGKVTGDKKSQKLEEEGINVHHLSKLDQRSISAWKMKRLVNIIRHSSLTHSIEDTLTAEGEGETEIQSEWQAKKAAKQIFRNVASRKARVIKEEDLMRFLTEEEVARGLLQFEGGSETKTITKNALKSWVINVYRERRALALSLNDTKTAVNKLHRIIDVIVGVIILVMWLLVLDIATTQLLLFTSSQFLLVILVWGNTLKTVLEAIVFLFIMHPFDVGDRCVVDGQQLVVEEMNILTTVFVGDYNVKIWYPNSVLATKPIQNYYRSPEMGDSVDFYTLTTIPLDKINSLKEVIGKYLSSKPQWWQPEFTLNVMEMMDAKKMKLTLNLKHTMNYQDLSERFKRKSELLVELKARCIELEMDYKPPVGEKNLNLRQEGTHEMNVRQIS